MPEKHDNIVPITSEVRSAAREFGAEHDRELLTILFTDLVDSTKLQSELGNIEAARLTELHRKIVRDELARYDAREIEWAGDSCLAVFTRPSDAVTFALRTLAEHRRVREDEERLPQVRVGLHLGEIVVKQRNDGGKKTEDLFGLQVSEAARVMSVARGDQIYCTRPVFDSARASLRGQRIEGLGSLAWTTHGLYEMKGSPDPVELCEVGESDYAPLRPPETNDKCRPLTAPVPEPARSGSRGWILGGAAAFLVLGVALGYVVFRQAVNNAARTVPPEGNFAVSATPEEEPREVRRIPMNLPPDLPLEIPNVVDTPLALSPDGTLLAYRANVSPRTMGIVVQRIGDLTANVVVETGWVDRINFSPDGKWIVYMSPSRLNKVSVEGGTPVELAPAPDTLPWPRWSEDGYIYYPGGFRGPIVRVHENGGEPEAVTTLEDEQRTHCAPALLPGGHGLLYNSFLLPRIESSRVMVWDFRTKQSRMLVDAAAPAFYLPTGHLVYVHADKVMAARFDAETLQFTGPHFDVTEEGLIRPGQQPTRWSASRSGTMAYVPSEQRVTNALEFVWRGLDGRRTRLDLDRGYYSMLDFSPDGSRVAVAALEGTEADIWIIDPERGTKDRFTDQPGVAVQPLWNANGSTIYYRSDRDGQFAMYQQSVDGSESARRLSGTEDMNPEWASSDDRTVVSGRGGDIYLVDLSGEEPKVETLVGTRFSEGGPAVSSDENWIAYVSNESSRYEVYLQPFPEMNRRIQVSTNGGYYPHWVPDTNRLRFVQRDPVAQLFEFEVRFDSEILLGEPTPLFAFGANFDQNLVDIHPSGDRYLTLEPLGDDTIRAGGTDVVIVENWFEEVKRLEPQTDRY